MQPRPCPQGPGTPKGAWRLEPLQGADPLILEAALHRLVAPVRDAVGKVRSVVLAELVESGTLFRSFLEFFRIDFYTGYL